jgi:multiple sugar transport system permease protein
MSVDVPTPTPAARSATTPAPSPFQAERPTFPVTRPDYTTSPKPPASPGAAARSRKNLALGLAFLAPNILGFLAFTAIPLVVSMVMAFSNWDLKLHNQFRDAELIKMGLSPEPIRWVGATNFLRLFELENFWKFLGNTLFFMIGMPFSIAASLGAAVMLSKDLRGGSRRVWLALIAGAVLVASTLMLAAAGAGGTSMVLLIGGLASGVVIAGVLGGTTVYRTLFYVPHFTNGVAVFLLWKKLYNPQNGPITTALSEPLTGFAGMINGAPPVVWQAGLWACAGLFMAVTALSLRRLRKFWEEGDVGLGAALLSATFVLLPLACALSWFNVVQPAAVFDGGTISPGFIVDVDAYVTTVVERLTSEKYAPAAIELTSAAIRQSRAAAIAVVAVGLIVLEWQLVRAARADRTFVARGMTGAGTGLVFACAAMVAMMVLLAAGSMLATLPGWAAHEGLKTPQWLQDVHWAKPAIMIMGFWGAIGSNTMLLYLAALTNVPQELYEAADIDGASRFQKFWNVTWPQLAPTTFFIVVMGVIGGLQGGFEMARVMTQGGPAGQTTTLSYFIYTEGFETGRLGFSSAVAWTLFLMVLVVTLFNWKFGNKYVND